MARYHSTTEARQGSSLRDALSGWKRVKRHGKVLYAHRHKRQAVYLSVTCQDRSCALLDPPCWTRRAADRGRRLAKALAEIIDHQGGELVEATVPAPAWPMVSRRLRRAGAAGVKFPTGTPAYSVVATHADSLCLSEYPTYTEGKVGLIRTTDPSPVADPATRFKKLLLAAPADDRVTGTRIYSDPRRRWCGSCGEVMNVVGERKACRWCSGPTESLFRFVAWSNTPVEDAYVVADLQGGSPWWFPTGQYGFVFEGKPTAELGTAFDHFLSTIREPFEIVRLPDGRRAVAIQGKGQGDRADQDEREEVAAG
jgi:hypothetical protein